MILLLSYTKLAILFQLTVLQGDIVKVAADAIVHPTNSTYHMGGEVGKYITDLRIVLFTNFFFLWFN